ncbi:MAG: HAD-IA family hydrolase [Gammaproteobacteria bacterium]
MLIDGDRIECMTFDLDDTLWLCEPVIHNAEYVFYTWLEQHFPAIAEDFDIPGLISHRRDVFLQFPEMSHDFSWLRKRWLEQLADDYGHDNRLVDEGFEVFLAARNDVTLFEGAIDLLELVSQRYQVGAITNGNADVHRVGIGHYFDFSISASGAGASKPSPVIFQAAADHAGVVPENILHIGDDAERDICGAARAGMKTLWINPQGLPWNGPHQPNHEVRLVTELRDLLG